MSAHISWNSSCSLVSEHTPGVNLQHKDRQTDRPCLGNMEHTNSRPLNSLHSVQEIHPEYLIHGLALQTIPQTGPLPSLSRAHRPPARQATHWIPCTPDKTGKELAAGFVIFIPAVYFPDRKRDF